jgi:hypothetical protein
MVNCQYIGHFIKLQDLFRLNCRLYPLHHTVYGGMGGEKPDLSFRLPPKLKRIDPAQNK